MTMTITGKHLINWGMAPGEYFPAAIAAAQRVIDGSNDMERARLEALRYQPIDQRRPLREKPLPFNAFLEPETDEEWQNKAAVERDMHLLMQVPTVTAGAYMPDACPAGSIPVGGVVETEDAIHPGFHSADICCSVGMTVLDREVDLKELLDAAYSVTHFGGGGRRDPIYKGCYPASLDKAFNDNPFLRDLQGIDRSHFATQGDGNHFLFVGRSQEHDKPVIVTHHGSRKPGAMLYRRGLRAAERHLKQHGSGIPVKYAWIPAKSEDGAAYWDALQTIRTWTIASHMAIHNATLLEVCAGPIERQWNEHNFVFERHGRFLHAKGATPAWGGETKLVPLNMAEPVLVVRGQDNASALGFCPHGAGRNKSRSAHKRDWGEMLDAELEELREKRGLDVRFWHDDPDVTELPSAYKRAGAVVAQMERFGLAKIVDRIEPYGSIMAGNWVRRN